MSRGCPWYVHEVPTVMVSLNHTTHLHDATTPRRHDATTPRRHDATTVKAYINAYHDNAQAIRLVVDKIMGGSPFRGTYNDLVWTEKWQAKL
jgi:beta-N-acetylhexosaminidase